MKTELNYILLVLHHHTFELVSVQLWIIEIGILQWLSVLYAKSSAFVVASKKQTNKQNSLDTLCASFPVNR